MLTRKDFQSAADHFRILGAVLTPQDRRLIVRFLCSWFRLQNPAFNEDRFRAAVDAAVESFPRNTVE